MEKIKGVLKRYLETLLGPRQNGMRRTIELTSVNGSDLTLAKVAVRERKLRRPSLEEIWNDTTRQANEPLPDPVPVTEYSQTLYLVWLKDGQTAEQQIFQIFNGCLHVVKADWESNCRLILQLTSGQCCLPEEEQAGDLMEHQITLERQTDGTFKI